MSPDKLRGDRGHSLMELLTVLAVIAIVVSATAPSMTGYLARNRARRALDRIANDVGMTRVLAVRSGMRVALQFVNDSTYSIVQQSSPVKTLKTVAIGKEFPGVKVTAPTADLKLEFDARGMLRSTPTGSLIARAAGRSDSATITAAGRVFRAY